MEALKNAMNKDSQEPKTSSPVTQDKKLSVVNALSGILRQDCHRETVCSKKVCEQDQMSYGEPEPTTSCRWQKIQSSRSLMVTYCHLTGKCACTEECVGSEDPVSYG